MRIAKYPVVHPLLEGIDHRRGGAEIHIGHPHGQHVFVIVMPFDAAGAAPVDEFVKVKLHGVRPFVLFC